MTKLKRALTLALLAIAWVWTMFPLYWAFIASIKLPKDQYRLAFIPWLQFQPTLMHWGEELGVKGRFIALSLGNSLMVGLGSAAIAVALGSLAGYGLARFRYRRWKNRDITLWFLSQRFLPPVAVVLPLFLFFRSLHLLDNVVALIMANATFTLPFAVLITKDAFRSVPEELEEAAWVDGASQLGSFLKVALPLASPALAAAFMIAFAFAWNEFLIALVLTYERAKPVTVFIAGSTTVQGVAFWYVGTRTLLAVLPPAIVAMLAQRYIVKGLTLGAVKG